MSVPQPEQAPVEVPRPRPRRSRAGRLVGWLVVLAILLGGTYGGYRLGQAIQPIEVWDPVWIRAKLDRPLDHTVPRETGLTVTGYYVDYDNHSYESFRDNSVRMDHVISFSFSLTADGSIVGKNPTALLGVAPPEKRIILFNNIDNNEGTFSGPLARTLLTKPDVQDKAIQNILAKLDELKAAGMDLDFEDVAPELRPQLTQFVSRLATELHKSDRILSMAVPAKMGDAPTSSWAGAFDYPALGQVVDQFMIMAYDEHYRGGEPGPVASLPWTEGVVRYAMSQMPTRKIVLGVPLYGYDWGPKSGKSVSQASASKLADKPNAKALWDEKMGETKLTYTGDDGEHVAWYPDKRSLDAKVALAKKYALQGVALWRLGFESPDDWGALPPPRAP